ncbi:MAG: hypothetical protein ABEJ55_03275 [Halanaeroarchaeum sp.]
MVTLPARSLAPFPRVSRYNSPYPAHDAGTAVDLYPGTETAPSPVAGDVVETRTVSCPSRPYAADHDHLIVVDTGEYLARVLHVRPSVGAGETIEVGDSLGTLVRSGYFAPWVDNHLHLGFRERDADPVRATGSLPLALDVPVEPVAWDGTGTVVETSPTAAVLDTPAHPAPGERYAGIADDAGRFVLDGGLPHYEWGGRLSPTPGHDGARPVDGTDVRFLGTAIGPAQRERVRWSDVTVLANGRPVHGLSLFLGRDTLFAKLIDREHDFAEGDSVTVTVEPPSA